MSSFVRATRSGAKLLIGLSGPSGGGKTYSALLLAQGLAAGGPIAVIDTEAGRASHYADTIAFDVARLEPPFRPQRYQALIEEAARAGYRVIVVDSMTHEHAGPGGLLDWHEEELARMAGEDPRKREACKLAAWVQPKHAHKQLVDAVTRCPAHVILTFRADQHVEMVRNEEGRWEVRPKRLLGSSVPWTPVSARDWPYELTVHVLVTPEDPGRPIPIKVYPSLHAILGERLDRAAGERLRAWAEGPPSAAPAAPATLLTEQDALPPERADDGRQRAVLLGRISGLADRKRIPAEVRQRLWDAIVGAGVPRDRAPLEALERLYRQLQGGDNREAPEAGQS